MSRKRLMVIDDEAELANTLCEFAREFGFEAKPVTSSIETKKEISSFAPSVIVIDIIMPDMDGIEIVHYLANEHSNARVILITGYEPRYAESAGIIGERLGLLPIKMLNKPFTKSEFHATLREIEDNL